jgi:hypothetical protein
MDVLRILIWVLGGLVIVMLVWRVVRLARLLEKRIEEYDEKERSEVERNLFAELSELYAQDPPQKGQRQTAAFLRSHPQQRPLHILPHLLDGHALVASLTHFRTSEAQKLFQRAKRTGTISFESQPSCS